MTIPVWVLLGYAGWTLLILFATVGVYRWSRILTGRATIREWSADEEQGSGWYRRAMRAHMNCIENLPVYAAIVVAIMASGLNSPWLDGLAVALLAFRMAHSLWHIFLEQTEVVASIRFALYFAQILILFAMGISVAVNA
ncbi:MAPEG family protein [Thiohalorhabdus sp. Cl-TMA]|uniref:MAPEG family protein n=1 Tax=Thiohalorhabdus methylotrophus TaxID=3242694 RepID=A0ABV4TT06_9GAMM